MQVHRYRAVLSKYYAGHTLPFDFLVVVFVPFQWYPRMSPPQPAKIRSFSQPQFSACYAEHIPWRYSSSDDLLRHVAESNVSFRWNQRSRASPNGSTRNTYMYVRTSLVIRRAKCWRSATSRHFSPVKNKSALYVITWQTPRRTTIAQGISRRAFHV